MTDPNTRSSVIGTHTDEAGTVAEVEAISFTDGRGIEATVWTKGATLASVRLPSPDGEPVEVTDGPADVDQTLRKPMRYAGASVGRFANRISGARFVLDGVEHRLAENEDGNQLHGGPGGFDARMWAGRGFVADDRAGVRLRLLSPAGDQGYPGTLAATATYTVSGHTLTIDYLATTDAPTVVNLTNHTYWNLSGDPDDVLGSQYLAHTFTSFIGVGEDGIPIAGAPLPLADSRFEVDAQVPLGHQLGHGGIDHCFVGAVDHSKACVALSHPESGRRLSITTDQPGLQIYTGNHLVPKHRSVAFEAQRWPDSPNRPDFPTAVLLPGEVYRHRTRLTFDW